MSIMRTIRVLVGACLLIAGVVTWNPWFLLGVIPIIAGIGNFCPVCKFTNSCKLPKGRD